MSFTNYNKDLDILTRKMNSLMNTNLVEKDEQTSFNNFKKIYIIFITYLLI